MIKVSLKYAVICGIFLTILYHLSFLFESNPLTDIRHLLFDVLLFGLFIFFAEKEFKIYKNGHILHFWQGMTIGFLVYGVATALFILGLALYFRVNPDAIEAYREAAAEYLNHRSGVYKEQFGEGGFVDQMEKIDRVTASDLLFTSGIKKILAGFFVTPVISIILRKQPK